MTLLQIVNAVLRRLREDEVTTVTQSDYARLIVDFVNQAKREVEDAWNWTQLRTTVTVTTASGTQTYTMTGAGDRFRILNAFNSTNKSEMRQVTQHYIDLQNNIGTTQNESPIFYNIRGVSGGDPIVYLWPVPNAVETLNFQMVVPQDDLSDDADVLSIPSWPVLLGAYAKAVSERGEDGGFAYAEAIGEYSRSMSDAIAIDAMNQMSDTTWVVV